MNILFDHQTFSLQEYGGISRYFSELIQGINANTPHTAYLSLLYTNNAYAHDLHLSSRHFLPGINFSKKMPLLYRLNKTVSTIDLITKSYDIVHATYYDPYFLRFIGKRPIVVTFLDMIHERFSAQFTELADDQAITARKRIIAERSTHIIAISESTKNDIIDLFGTDPNKISVIHLGSSFLPDESRITVIRTNKPFPYILFVGQRGHYKNFDLFLAAVAPLLQQYGLRVICAGGGAFTRDELTYISSLKLTGYVSQEPINDQTLRTLYTEALLFVFPSLYEGFGIPVLEAFSCDCPCAVSNQSSLPEVAGNAAIYFDPTDIDSIRTSIDKLLNDNNMQTDLVQKGRQRATQFSWQRTVRETVSLYEKL